MKPEIRAAALHLAAGALEKREAVPPGHHKLDNLQVVLTFPAHASVDRAEGTEGDGFDAGTVPEPKLSPMAVQLFLRGVIELLPKAEARKLAQVATDAIAADERGDTCEPPAVLVEAMIAAAAAKPPAPAKPKATPAKRTGAGEIQIDVRRAAAKAVRKA